MQITQRYEELEKDGDDFVCKLVMTLDNGENMEEHIGRGRSKKEAKQNAASCGLQRSHILQPFTGGVLFVKCCPVHCYRPEQTLDITQT